MHKRRLARISTPTCSRLVFKFNTGEDRRNKALLAFDIIPDDKINMDNCKDHKPPHYAVMEKAAPLLAAK